MQYRKVAYSIVLCVLFGFGIVNHMDNREVMVIQGKATLSTIKEDIVKEGLTGEQQNSIININKADTNELEKLYKIGPKTAEKIIKYREENGDFKNKEEIMNVSGIGIKTYEGIKDYIRVK